MNKPQLFVIHFAGGNYYSYNFLIPLLPDFDIVPLELPGRGKRIREKLLYDFEQAANDLYNQLTNKLSNGKFIIYGHSMGAYLTLRLCNMLEKVNKSPILIFVSGNAGPGMQLKKRYQLEDNLLINELKELGGISTELEADRKLLEFFLPIIRADFEIVERSAVHLAMEKPVNAPIYAMMGEDEEQASNIQNWRKFSKTRFDYKLLNGGHFFIYRNAEIIAGVIRANFRNQSFY
jgi:surfactin synthase thioesterase subunit